MNVPEKRTKELAIEIRGRASGTLARVSQYTFEYAQDAQLAISRIMPIGDRSFRDNELFAVMDMNLPEGFLLAQIRERAPKTPPTKMQLLSWIGSNGIGWLEYLRRDAPRAKLPPVISKSRLLKESRGRHGQIFAELVDAYLATGSGLSGVQPKILVPERASIPNLLVKVAGDDYPGLAANEFLCLEVARRAGIPVASHDLSNDGALLVVDRFDIDANGARLGFEDIAALLDLRVGGALSNRKYRGSYEDVAEVIRTFSSQQETDLGESFSMVALSVLLRNGDAHLKNFAMLYNAQRCWLAPVYDVVTTTLYAYERANGERVVDRTMALKLRRGDRARAYPSLEELVRFGREVCGVEEPRKNIRRITKAMEETLSSAKDDARTRDFVGAALHREWKAL